jgi:glucokinase
VYNVADTLGVSVRNYEEVPAMYLAIEIGATKLQATLGRGDGSPLAALVRRDAQPQYGAEGIRRQIAEAGKELLREHHALGIGIGFGGPVDSDRGRTLVSHQVDGWENFPLVDWCRETFGLPAVLANDSDCAGLAEACFGAGRGEKVVFYSNIGSGIGGAFVIDGRLHQGGAGIASEIGHLRPGPQAETPDCTVESLASGWGITAFARQRIAENPDRREAKELLAQCGHDAGRLNTKLLADASRQGNPIAREAFERCIRTMGWALAQMITLLAPNVVVLGGGVSLLGDELLDPLRASVRRYVFPPLLDSYQIRQAVLGEEVVLHGALAVAAAEIGAIK